MEAKCAGGEDSAHSKSKTPTSSSESESSANTFSEHEKEPSLQIDAEKSVSRGQYNKMLRNKHDSLSKINVE